MLVGDAWVRPGTVEWVPERCGELEARGLSGGSGGSGWPWAQTGRMVSPLARWGGLWGAWGLVVPLLRRSRGPSLRESWRVSRVYPAGKVPELMGKMGGGVSHHRAHVPLHPGHCVCPAWDVAWGTPLPPGCPPCGLVSELEGAVSLQGAAAIQQPAVGEAPARHQGLPELRHTGAVLGGGACRVTWGPGCTHRSNPSSNPSSYPGPR